jgi:hypothetical protein
MTEAGPRPPKVIDVNATRPASNVFGVYAMSVNEGEQWAFSADCSPIDEQRVLKWEKRGQGIRKASACVLIIRHCIGHRETSDSLHGASRVSVLYTGCNFAELGRIYSDESRTRLLKAEHVLT